MTYNYNLDNFVSNPVAGDTRLMIFDKNGNFTNSIIPDISHFFVKNNCLVIKMTNENDIILSFESRAVAQQALEKLDAIRMSLLVLSGEFDRNSRPTLNTMNRYMRVNRVIDHNCQLVECGPVAQIPKSLVKVLVNQGGFVYCGKTIFTVGGDPFTWPLSTGTTLTFFIPNGCYFTSPADTGNPYQARVNDGDVQIGDLLYWIVDWNGNGEPNYPLDVTDTLDFEYLI